MIACKKCLNKSLGEQDSLVDSESDKKKKTYQATTSSEQPEASKMSKIRALVAKRVIDQITKKLVFRWSKAPLLCLTESAGTIREVNLS